jgi:uncharacterized protein
MKNEILAALARLEEEEDLRVLMACESGSRAWGFASADSDYDVRFIYVRRRDDYLRVCLADDHLHHDFPGDLDVSGWDLRKALSQLAKSNAAFLEWLHSPVIYRADEAFLTTARELAGSYFQPAQSVGHYLGLARQLWLQAGDNQHPNGKKCLYVLRAILCAKWVIEKNTAPPVAFSELLQLLPSANLKTEIEALVAEKALGVESDHYAISAELLRFILSAREELEEKGTHLLRRPYDLLALDHFFQKTII